MDAWGFGAIIRVAIEVLFRTSITSPGALKLFALISLIGGVVTLFIIWKLGSQLYKLNMEEKAQKGDWSWDTKDTILTFFIILAIFAGFTPYVAEGIKKLMELIIT